MIHAISCEYDKNISTSRIHRRRLRDSGNTSAAIGPGLASSRLNNLDAIPKVISLINAGIAAASAGAVQIEESVLKGDHPGACGNWNDEATFMLINSIHRGDRENSSCCRPKSNA